MEIIIKLENGRQVRLVVPDGKAISSTQLALLMKWAREGKSAELAHD